MLRDDRVEIECDRAPEERGGRLLERREIVIDEPIDFAKQVAMLSAHRAPHERTILRVELLHTTSRFDDFGSRNRQTNQLAHDDGVTAGRHDAHAPVATVTATN